MYPDFPRGMSAGARIKAHLKSNVTWTSLLYLVAKFPLGIISFALTMGLVSLTARLLFRPLPYLIDASAGRADSIRSGSGRRLVRRRWVLSSGWARCTC